MARPNQDAVPKDDVPWWMKYAGRGLGTVGGFSKFYSINYLIHTGYALRSPIVISYNSL